MIRGKRIRSLDKYFKAIESGATIIIGISDIEAHAAKLKLAGFTGDLNVGETILPSSRFGPRSRYNANGDYEIHRDQPKETLTRLVDWEWEEWHGQYTVTQSKLVDVPYERYPRTFLPPPSVELRIATNEGGAKVVVCPGVVLSEENEETLLHTGNLFLEIFEECQIFTTNLEQIVRGPIVRLNWEVLPPGKRPWDKMRQEVKPIVDQQESEQKKTLIWRRFESVNSYEPDFLAVGRAGFSGYIVFGFGDRSLYVLESIHLGNATYVFGEDWETLSQMTKAEILNQDLQVARLIHNTNWDANLQELMADE